MAPDFTLDRIIKASGIALIGSTWLLSRSYPSSFAYERPVHSIVLVFAFTSCLLINLSKLLPTNAPEALSNTKYEALPLEESSSNRWDSNDHPQRPHEVKSLGPRSLKALIFIAACIVSARIEILRQIFQASECTVNSPEVLLPLLYVVYDSLRFQGPRYRPQNESIGDSTYDALYERYINYCFKTRWRYLPATILIMFGTRWLTYLESGLNTTYICPVTLGLGDRIPLMQWAALSLDFILLIILAELSIPSNPHNAPSPHRMNQICGTVLAISSCVWVIIGIVVFKTQPENRDWLVQFNPSSLWGALGQCILFTIFCITASHTLCRIGGLALLLTLSIAFSVVPSLHFVWTVLNPFPATPWTISIFPFFLIFAGHTIFSGIRNEVEPKTHLFSWGNVYLKFILLLIAIAPVFFKPDVASYHPIDMLIYQAKNQSIEYAKYVTQGRSLEYAVAQYRRRYTRNPPPGFNHWYEYASQRDSVIIDQYDQIYDDLLPFWSVEPAEIRRLTMKLTSDPWNEVGLIKIRNGSVAVGDNVVPTHRWMMEGVSKMIENFVEFLPDMDLAFNINDETRVAVPYHDITSRRKTAKAKEHALGVEPWTPYNKDAWIPNTFNEDHSLFELYSFRNTFSAYGSVACPPNSRARSRAITSSSKSHLDYNNISPHSLGQFLSDWQLSKSICHQPDMAHLHGFYTSPASFKGSHTLLPVFSQSKAHGFTDILYPSAWNYIDKVAYQPTEPSPSESNQENTDPPFRSKQNTLFWRGATSEGVSPGTGTWRGMTRQRLVHLANNLTSSPHDEVTLLVQDPYKRSGRYRHINVPGPALRSLGLNTDIQIVDHIVRCGGRPPHSDCADQEAEFTFARPVDFQSHWKHRYLFDLDGAGFSGRFLPFLQSRSLPFKTALFREWFEERVTPWAHFVPLDLRLHGVFSTLAYFAGVEGRDPRSGKNLYIGNHVKEAEKIAEAGREWANKVLRKEDMEIYFFRLLLEWGRIVDDRREDLGFSGMMRGG